MQGKDGEALQDNDGHMKIALRFLAILATLGAAQPSAFAADISNGQKLAEHWCSACHLISPAQKRGSADVATFGEIARRTDARTLSLFLTKPHGQMPDLTLSQPEIADLVTYIESFGPNPVPPDIKPEAPAQGLSGAIAPSK
jgi:mono/diheme cytochrome c family protein